MSSHRARCPIPVLKTDPQPESRPDPLDPTPDPKADPMPTKPTKRPGTHHADPAAVFPFAPTATRPSAPATTDRPPLGLRWWIDRAHNVRVGWPAPDATATCLAFGWLHPAQQLAIIEDTTLDNTELRGLLSEAFPDRELNHATNQSVTRRSA